MLNDKVAIITGAAQGLGRATAEVLAERGASVVIADINGEQAERTAGELREKGAQAMGLKLDVTSEASVVEAFDSVVSRLGRIDVLVNNAGIFARGSTLEFGVEQWNRVLDINLKGVFLCGRTAAKVMIPQGGGKIVNIASVVGHVCNGGVAAYSASKGGVLSLTRVMAVEWGKHNIRVNSVSPGSMGTDMTKASKSQVVPGTYERMAQRIPSPRSGRPSDIANAVAFLLSDEADFINGRDLIVDGGLLCCDPGFVL